MKLNAMLWFILITKVLWFSSHLGVAWEREQLILEISMLGRDAHIINNLSNHVLPSFMLILVFHCQPRYKERVHLWNHEPRSIFNHKKHLSNHFYHFTIFCHLKIRKYKNTFTSCIHNTKHKNIIHHCFHHPCIFIYHHCIFIYCFAFILFWYHSHTLCLTTTWWGWGHKTIYFCLHVSKGRIRR